MYLNTFGFDEPPFSITPDPKFVFLSKKHQESLAHLVYGISRGGGAGFVQLTGEVGTGKTTISRLLLAQIPEKTNIALILNPIITPLELIQNICKELKVSMRGIKGKLNALVDKLNSYLLQSWANGESTVVIIDEAQNLARDTLEQLRLLTNLETDKQKLLQIILIGQPELRSTMRRDDLRQLSQRVTARYHLMPLDANETFDYLQHRVSVAGGRKNLINFSIAKKIHKLTNGVPRLINILTDRTLLAAYSDNSSAISFKHIKIAAKEVLPETTKPNTLNNTRLALMLLGLIGFVFLVWLLQYKFSSDTYNSPSKSLPTANIITFNNASSKQVWDEYFHLWDTKIEKNWHKAECPKSIDTGMACLRKQGNLLQLKKLNCPVILQLEDNTLVLLVTLKDNMVGLLNQSKETTVVSKTWLNQRWLGTYFVIWSMPAELLIEPTAKQLSNWSLEMANTLASDKITTNQLTDWIKTFQSNNGLIADGIIGKETQMTLSLQAYKGPTLTN